MIKTNCYNVSQTQRPIDNRFEFCKQRKYQLHLNTDSAWELFALKNWPFIEYCVFCMLKLNGIR
jgi:hypothetical protein